MSFRERLLIGWRWLAGPRGLMLFAVSLLFVLMAASFVNIPWNLPAAKCGGTTCEIPVTWGGGLGTTEGIAEVFFGRYVTLVLLIALVLGACMVGGVYLAKTEERS